MKTKVIIQRDFKGRTIRQDLKTGFLNINDLHKVFYMDDKSNNKQIDHFWELQSVKKWLIQHGGKEKNVLTQRGKYGGTWLSEELTILFFNWLQRKPIDKYMRFENRFVTVCGDMFNGVIDFKTQYEVGRYRLDIYFPSINLAIEYDEPHHAYNILLDNKRERFIKNKLKCDFIRVKQGQEMQGIKEIIKNIIHKYKKFNVSTN